jgi:hypothetical protein
MLTLHCTDREMNDGSASDGAIAASGSTTAVAMTSWSQGMPCWLSHYGAAQLIEQEEWRKFQDPV